MERKRRPTGDQGIWLSLPMLSLKNELSCATQKITEFAKQTNKKKCLGISSDKWIRLKCLYREKMLDKTSQSFPPSITHERCNATTKDSRTPLGLCLRSAIKKDPDRLPTALQEHLQLGQPESFPWEPGPPGAAPPSACMRLHLCSQAPPTPAVIYLWISGVQCKVASVLSDSLWPCEL